MHVCVQVTNERRREMEWNATKESIGIADATAMSFVTDEKLRTSIDSGGRLKHNIDHGGGSSVVLLL
jgi:hypothetical protein